MNAQEASDLLCGVVNTYAVANNFPVGWEDVDFDIPTGQTVWLRVTMRHATSHQSAFAADGKLYDMNGTFYVQIFSPMGDGKVKGLAASQGVIDALRAFKHPVLWLHSVRLNELGSDGAFQKFNVLSTFTYSTIG